MTHMQRLIPGQLIAAGLIIALLLASPAANANEERVLYTFLGGRYGANPDSGVIADAEWLRLTFPADYRGDANKIQVSATAHASTIIVSEERRLQIIARSRELLKR